MASTTSNSSNHGSVASHYTASNSSTPLQSPDAVSSPLFPLPLGKIQVITSLAPAFVCPVLGTLHYASQWRAAALPGSKIHLPWILCLVNFGASCWPTTDVDGSLQVGNQFVTQYYHVKHLNPKFLHRFYNDSSQMSILGLHGFDHSIAPSVFTKGQAVRAGSHC
jgi:hypothetical protein